MKPTLNLLCVDDDSADADLELSALRHEFTVVATRVDTAVALGAALQSGQHEIVLCDYSMPHFSGPEALALWQAAGAPIPFVFVSGKLSEEVAVECIKAGATDYVLKDNLTRLPTAVGRALREFAGARELRRVQAERARIAAAVAQMDEGLLITESDGRIVYVNPAFTRITGYDLAAVIGQTPRLMRPGTTPQSLYSDMWRRITAGEVWSGQLVNRRRDGSCYDAEVTIAPVFDSEGRLINFCSIQRDVSARVAAERHLRELNAQLAETDRLKDEFLAAFSHELRMPLHVILGYADLLQGSVGAVLSPDVSGKLDVIARSAGRLSKLINETLDLARLRIKAIRPQFEPFDLAILVREVAEAFAPLAASKGVTLHCEVAAAPMLITTDPIRVRQVIGNLVDNAVKFTDHGEVRVGSAVDAGQAIVEVRDTGIGVAAADIPHMFEDFRQLSAGSTRRYGGCGLGLALTKRWLVLLGGSVEVESELGRGSCFRVTLPRTPPAAND
ncbi:MAG: PAS domain S-box protein [Deltaproteobacteria bacterium]|nr:PAS domain S-box protein [Deltaproteobacteria bacterium]MBI3390920.1 PAS domain S-box protein [Deltaproteobacteria bacterium]